MHFQLGASAQDKLITVLKGRVLDEIVDVRRDSNIIYAFSIELKETNHTQYLLKDMLMDF